MTRRKNNNLEMVNFVVKLLNSSYFSEVKLEILPLKPMFCMVVLENQVSLGLKMSYKCTEIE